MDRDSLIERANRWTVPRYGLAVSDRQLRDWVDEELVEPPHRVTNQGQRAAAYDWSPESYLEVLKVARARRDGLNTFDMLRVHLWLKGRKRVTSAVRQSMVSEHRRLQKALYRSRRGESEPALSKKIDNPNSKGRYIGPRADPRLKPISDLIDEQTAFKFHQSYRFGTDLDIQTFCQNIWHTLVGFDLKPDTQTPAWPPTVSGIGQIPEDDDEVLERSAEYTLCNASAESMNKVRRLCRSLINLADLPRFMAPEGHQIDEGVSLAFREILNQTRYFEWNFFFFYMFLHATRQDPPTDAFLGGLERGLPMNVEIG